MWLKNLRIYRLDTAFALSAQQLADLLAKHQFAPCGNQEPLSLGWVPPREGGELVHEVNGQYLICMRAEKKLLPSVVVNQTAREKAREIEEQQGYKPGRKQMKEIKEQIIIDLMPRSHAVQRDTMVWIDTRNHWFVIDAADDTSTERYSGMARCLTRDSELLVHEECCNSEGRRLRRCCGNVLHDDRCFRVSCT